MIETNPFPFLEHEVVTSLLKVDIGDLDKEVIQDIFAQRDANLIMSIPLPKEEREDKLIWSNDEKHIFTMKNCYRALMGEMQESML